MAGASGRGRDVRGRGSIAGLLRTAVGGALTGSVALPRARSTDRAAPAAAAASSAVADSFLANSGSGRSPTLALPLVRSAAMVTAPVEPRRGTGTSPTRWPKPQHGEGR